MTSTRSITLETLSAEGNSNYNGDDPDSRPKTTTWMEGRPLAEPPEPVPEPEEHSEAKDGLDKKILVKYISAGFSFFVAGVNDGSLGVLIPHVINYYGISTAIVSSVYGTNLLGWLSAALSNTHLSQRLDLGAMLTLGAVLQVVAHALRAWPGAPFGLYVFTFWLTALGQAFQDTHANTFVATVNNSSSGGGGAATKKNKTHRWLGFIHAMYMAGCLVGPFAASPIASSSSSSGGSGSKSRWYLFYTVPLGFGVANLALAVVAFRDSLRVLHHRKPRTTLSTATQEIVEERKSATSLIKQTLFSTRSKPSPNSPNTALSCWTLSLFFFFYVGTAITAGGWVVEYLVDVRNGELSEMGYVPAGFSGGCLLGRILLPEPTHRFGERRMVFLYCVLCLVFQLVFWLVPNIIAASVSISLLGFFSGPLFAAGISVGSKLFPPELNATAISFVFVFAQLGGSFFPVLTGVLGSRMGPGGVRVMQPVLVGLISATGISWLFVPNPAKGKEP